MGFYLQPSDIVDCFTLKEITDEITSIQTAINDARPSVSDKFDDMQASQQIRRQKLEDLRVELAVWVKAKNLLNETDSSTAELIAGNYNPAIPRF